MGDGCRLRCKKCGYHTSIYFGVGFHYYKVCDEIKNEILKGKLL